MDAAQTPRFADRAEGHVHAGEAQDALRRGLVFGRGLDRLGTEYLADRGERGLLGAGREETVGADLLEALGQDMEQEAPDELRARERHLLERVAVGAVAQVVVGGQTLRSGVQHGDEPELPAQLPLRIGGKVL